MGSWYRFEDQVIQVMLNDVEIDFPLTKILGWVEKHEKEKMEEMK